MGKDKKFRESLHADVDRRDAKARADRTLVLPKSFFTKVEEKNNKGKKESSEHYTDNIRD